MMPINKVEENDNEIISLLEGTAEAWEQYKRGQGALITSDEELGKFLDSL